MANTSACMRQLNEVDLLDCSVVGGSSDSEYVTALAGERECASTTLSPVLSARSESLMLMLERTEIGNRSSIEDDIEHSKRHWSLLSTPDPSCIDEGAVAEIDNFRVFQSLQLHPTWGRFFRTFGYDLSLFESSGELVVGDKFAEGGQAELCHAHITWRNPWNTERDLEDGIEWVLKVFKKGTFLRVLRDQMPHGLLQFHAEEVERSSLGKPASVRYNCSVGYGTLLKDGRFAFLMVREEEDMRTLIDRNMLASDQDHGPFSEDDAELIMYRVAEGMDWLHRRNIVHRDLKASNVLVRKYTRGWYCYVADFECSIGVVGTGFFRAPEILQACKDRTLSKNPNLFSKEVDVYSYGMTCFEILTGKLPFEGHPVWDYGCVLGGQRPIIPRHVPKWACELLNKCWQFNPVDRPSFEEILELLSANSAAIRDHKVRAQLEVQERAGARQWYGHSYSREQTEAIPVKDALCN